VRPSVRVTFPPFTARFEGTVLTMYADILGLVTIGRGNLIDPESLAVALPFVRIVAGTPASSDEILAEWTRVKTGGFASAGWRAAARNATIMLTPESVDALTLDKLSANDARLAARLGSDAWEALPASAQLAIHSWAWAAGPAAVAPRLWAALAAGDWATCADEVHLADAGNPGLVPRNAANRALFLACAATDPDVVAWP